MPSKALMANEICVKFTKAAQPKIMTAPLKVKTWGRTTILLLEQVDQFNLAKLTEILLDPSLVKFFKVGQIANVNVSGAAGLND